MSIFQFPIVTLKKDNSLLALFRFLHFILTFRSPFKYVYLSHRLDFEDRVDSQ